MTRSTFSMMVGLAALASPLAARAGLDPVNLALNKPARQSSTLFGADASRAVDGNTNATFSFNSVTHTDFNAHSWWEVDLGQVRQISRVEITNRVDCCAERLIPFVVIVADIPIIDSDITDADANAYPGIMRTTITGQVQLNYAVPVNRSGRYVRIALLNQNYLSLAEVKVLEADSAARGRAVQQSSTAVYGSAGTPADASRAVDGNVNGALSGGSVSATNVEQRPWWQVDMGLLHVIRQIDVWSATDCCSTLNPRPGFWVWVSPNPITADPVTTALPDVRGVYVNSQSYPATVPLNLPGRYVRIELNGTDALALAEVQVWPVARGSVGGHASMSSAVGLSDANTAIDLNTSSLGPATTQSQTEPYWDVDLGAVRYLETVKLWSQSPNNSLATYNLFVSNTDFVSSSGAPVTSLAATRALPGVSSWVGRGTSTSSATSVMRQGRFIRVMLNGTNALVLSEAEVVTTEGWAASNGYGFNAATTQAVPNNLGVPVSGYFPRPGVTISAYAFRPNAGAGGGSYVWLSSTTTSSTPLLTGVAAAPLYPFSFSATLPADTWPSSGVGDIMFQALDNGGFTPTPLRGLDADLNEHVFWPDNRMVSTASSPDDNVTKPLYLESPMGTTVNPNYTADAPPPRTGLDFFELYIGTTRPSADAYYYNDGDLGLGRTMDCARVYFSTTSLVACQVTNYAQKDANGNVMFGYPQGAAAALHASAPVATVAMTIEDGSGIPKFTAYAGAGGPRLTSIPLDGTGRNTAIPNNCMTCHGGSGAGFTSTGVPYVKRATFLPFDVQSFLGLGSTPLTSFAEQFRKLNALVLSTNTTPAIVDLINGWYHNAVNTPNTPFDGNYVPPGWSVTPAEAKVYSQVIKPFCRTCHIAQLPIEGGLDFLKASDAEAFRAVVVADVCKAHRMPHAQQVLKRLWRSGGRAQLLGFFGRHDYDGELCSP